MIELRLVGYTAELGHLVLDVEGADGGRYRLVVDEDLFATMDELREERRSRGLAVGDLVEYADELGLSVDHLRRVTEDDRAQAAAAGQVSAGDAAASALLAAGTPPSLDDQDEFEPADEDPWAELDLDEPAGDEEVEVEVEDEDPDAGASDHPWDLDEGYDDDRHVVAPPAPVATPTAGSSGVRVVPAPVRDAPDGTTWGRDDGLVARFLDERSQPEAPDDDDPWADEEDGPDEDGSGHAGWDEDAAPTAGRHDDVEEVAPQPVRQQPRPLVTQPRPTRGDPAPSRPVQTRSAMDRPQRPQPTLTPAEIQSRLRSGDSVRAVAKAAGVDEEWVRRWEVPILAERVRVLEGAHAARIHRPRLGRSAQPLGTAVRHNLGQRVDPDTVTWDVARRRDGRWRVTVRWVAQGGRKRSATWTWDEQERELVAASDAARDLGFVRRATRG